MNASPHDALKQMAERVTVAKPTMPVLREGGMLGHSVFQAQSTKPAIGQIQVHFFAQSPFGSNAEAVADEQHPNRQLRVDRRPTCVAVLRR